MKLIRFNPAHKHLFSEDFITGFNEGAKRQFENDIRPKGKWLWADGVRCSRCNYKLQSTGLPSYCPNCGAEMEVE